MKIYSPEKITKNNNNNNVINLSYRFNEISAEYYFIKGFIPKFYIFLKNNNIELFETPKNKSIFAISNDYEKYFYIYKYKWKYIYKIKYRYNESNYKIITAKGDFKSTKDFKYFDFSNDFKKNIFKNNEVKESILWYETFINKSRPLENIINNNLDIAINKNLDFIDIIDIIYLIDSTGSMGDELKNATKLSINNANYLHKNYPNIDFKFGFIYYSDPINCPLDKKGYIQLTKDFTEIQKFCDNWQMQGGGDLAEDWAGGYDIALSKINWRKGKFIIHICDAPAHGALFSKDANDEHKEKKYEDDLINNIKKCAKESIEIIGVYKGENAENCFLECKKIYDENKGKTFIIQKYEPNNLLNLVPNSILNNKKY